MAIISRIARILPLAWLLLAALHGAAAAADRRVALVIGNATYRNAPVLTNPVGDAEAIAGMLRNAGFDSVDLKLNLDNLDLKRAIRSFLTTVKDSDIAVVYFAGHGIEVNGTNYIIPVDARLKTDFDAEDEGLTLDRIIRAVEPARRLRLIILDACRDNPFIPRMQRTVSARGISAGLGKVEPEANTLVAYAARAGSVAEDGSGAHSPFTTALLKHLATPGLDIRVAFGRVRDEVLRSTGGNQEPFVYGSLGGSTVSILRDEAMPEKAVVPKPDPFAETRRDYEFAERVGTMEAWHSFLQAHPSGFLADLARAQSAKLRPALATTAAPAIDASKPDLLRSKVPTPATAAIEPGRRVPDLDAKASPPIAERESGRDPCSRDRETLARLRDNPVASEIAQFARTLSCRDLRPQVARLLESAGPAGDTSLAVVPEAVVRPVDGGLRPRPAQPGAVASRGGGASAVVCAQESQILARLREAPDLREVARFAQDLTCRELKPQVQRLLESLDDR